MNTFENIEPARDLPSYALLDSHNFDAFVGLKQMVQVSKNQGIEGQDGLDFDTQSLYKGAENRPTIANEHAKLSDWAKKNLTPDLADSFNRDLKRFEERAKENNVSSGQVLKTFQQIERLNLATGDSPLDAGERNKIALQIINNAANPTDISQGSYKTCNVTTVETRIYTRTPAEAARLVADIALTGKYTAADGTTVEQNPKQALDDKPALAPDGERSAASQIFQVTAVNLHYRSGIAQGEQAHFVYIQGPKSAENPSGEILWDNQKGASVTTVEKHGKQLPVNAPGLSNQDIADISNTITGKHEHDVLLQANPTHSDSVKWIQDIGDLEDTLARLKAEQKLPVIVNVDTDAEPFYLDQGADGASTGAHVVTITDYDAKTKEICVDNQWHHASDHGKDNPITSHDLFIAMQSRDDQAEMYKNESRADRSEGVYRPSEDAEAIRHQMQLDPDEGKISNAAAESEIMRIQDDMKKHRDKEGISKAEDEAADRELKLAITLLPLDEQMHLNDRAFKLGLISDQERDIRNTILIPDETPLVVLTTVKSKT